MAKYRNALPQLSGDLFITDGGAETTLIFHEGVDLPEFAAFTLLKDSTGQSLLDNYFRRYIQIARDNRTGFILESITWRASRDWGRKLGYDDSQLAEFNRQAITMLETLREEYEDEDTPMVISGCIGPRDDGYNPSAFMSATEAQDYHSAQIETFAGTAADLVSAMTMSYPEEAIGITRAAKYAGMPAVISFTVETDGRLPDGQSLQAAIEETDAATQGGPDYYMINCAHPTHFQDAIASDAPWLERIRGLRANASAMSHAELDESETLDDGNPEELGEQYRALRQYLRHLNILGGCCGTDHRHVEAITRSALAK
jgi:S-methylmethionine-dependent homocysteine/selenocysteine methylase